jgi:hypothetical protein
MGEVDPDLEWIEYLNNRRRDYIEERKRIIGPEYNANKSQWDQLFEQEWLMMEERLRAGFGVAEQVKAQFGEDFFKAVQMEALMEQDIHLVTDDWELITVVGASQDQLPLVYYEDFVMLTNQGIFRLEEFLLDKGRRWERKVVEDLAQRGYQKVGNITYDSEVYIHVSRS